MYPLLLFSTVLLNFVYASDLNHTNHGIEAKHGSMDNKNVMGIPLWKQHFWEPHKLKMAHNSTYFEKAENMIRLPAMNQFEDKKKRFIKKSPKRTIQKIIKKNKQKTKRIYIVKTQSSTMSPEARDKGLEDMSAWKDDLTTVPPNQRKKLKKYSSRIARYPMPFQKLQKKKLRKRDKRNTYDREDFYILKDFDEMKFLRDDKDVSVVKTHVKKYWCSR